MSITRRDFFKIGGLAALGATAGGLAHAQARPAPARIRPAIRWRGSVSTVQADPALHLLRRASFGPARAELARMRRMGVDAWLDEQLAPENIDDSELETRIARRYETLSMSPADLQALDDFPRIRRELGGATMERAVYSQRQLFQVMVDYWSNHFSVYWGDGPVRIFKTIEDGQVMRAHAMTTFRQILGADAHSPAMLVYLDNARSSVKAPNENYAREIMELHTLGVDGGYTEQDVKELARILTGWGVDRRTGDFRFYPNRHDWGEKTFLELTFPAGRGQEEGEEALDILARHESTSRYVAHRLCMRFVADEPPAGVVDAAARAFRQTSGDIRAVLRVILTHDDFYASVGQKLRRPFDLIGAAVRTLEIPNARGVTLARALMLMDQPLFGWPTPDGYPDDASAWLNANALLARWNIGLALAEGRDPGAQIPWDRFWAELGNDATAEETLDFFIDLVLHQAIESDDRAQLLAYLTHDGAGFDIDDPEHARRVPELVALLLDSSYFQWR